MNATTRNRSPRFASPLTAIAFAIFAFAGTGCSELIDRIDGAADDCMPGQVSACMCPGGSVGAQVCLDDGQSYGVCECSAAGATESTGSDDGSTDDASDDDGMIQLGEGPDDTWSDDTAADDTSTNDDWAPAPSDDETSVPEPLPDPDVELRSAWMHVVVIGGSLTAAINADWSVTGRDDVVVDIEVLSSITYRSWTTVAAGLPPVYFTEVSLPVTQGERRYDVRVVARDAAGGRWTSNTITIE